MSIRPDQEDSRPLETSPFENLQFNSASDFSHHIRFMRYVDAFCGMFAQRAPSAWESLLELQEASDAICYSGVLGFSETEEQQLRDLFTISIGLWADRIGIDAPWLIGVARLTLFANSVAKLLSLPPLTTLDYKHKPFSVFSEDGTVTVGWDVMTLTPTAKIVTEFNLGIQTWEPLAESPSKFKKRMHAELDALIHTQELEQERFESDITNLFWIEAFIDVRMLGQSVRKTARVHNVSRPAIDNAVEQASRILRFPRAT